MEKKHIFIHIPKTGGTTINAALEGTYWQTKPGFYYRHILPKSNKSNAGDIFQTKNRERFKDFTILTMVRHPVDRMISEYYFLRERQEYMKLLRPRPNNFKEYIRNRQTNNYMCAFLLGRKIYDPSPVFESDLEHIIDTMKELPVHVGIFEDFARSLSYFESVAGIHFPKKMEAKRMTFLRPLKDEIDDDLRTGIIENNEMDMCLYSWALDYFQKITKQLNTGQHSFELNRYNHVIPYVMRTCLFEFCMNSKPYLAANKPFFKNLTFYLLKNLQLTDGEFFVRTWNLTYRNALRELYSGTTFLDEIETAMEAGSDDALKQCAGIGSVTDRYFGPGASTNRELQKLPSFDPSLVETPARKKGGLFKKLFKR